MRGLPLRKGWQPRQAGWELEGGSVPSLDFPAQALGGAGQGLGAQEGCFLPFAQLCR